jgi:hypothetical protein
MDEGGDTFVELCVGSASVSLSIIGQTPVVAFAGSKTSYADQIIRLFGFDRKDINKFVWNDAGRWADTWMSLRDDRDMVLHKMNEGCNLAPPRGLRMGSQDRRRGCSPVFNRLYVWRI